MTRKRKDWMAEYIENMKVPVIIWIIMGLLVLLVEVK